MSKQYLGLGKTKYSSSICLINKDQSVEMLLTERLNRKKNSGAWPEIPLKHIYNKLDFSSLKMGENRDVHHPMQIEDIQNELFPFYDYLKKEKLENFTSRFNPDIEFITHHFCHASAALAISPFSKSVIIVMDGAGSEIENNKYEECSVFLQDGVNLVLSFRQEIAFLKSHKHSNHSFGNRIGALYEKASEFIFNSPNSSGKVMGLASFGLPLKIEDYYSFMESLPWELSFKKKSKKEWEDIDHSLFKNLAATVQKALEDDYDKVIKKIKELHPEYTNLILTGDVLLTAPIMQKILYQNLFDQIFVPPFPGDECIGFGLAHALKFKENPLLWKPLPFENQSAYLGPKESAPTDSEITKHFHDNDFLLTKVHDVCKKAAELLEQGHTIAWFQGRSESGPRALGNRSILSRPDIGGLKDKLNRSVKFRESFRPYGCSALYEKSHLYFEIEEGFNNPYMSYAIRVRPEYKTLLKEVSHVDETSRMQTVRKGQNAKFYKLIEEFGNLSGLYCLLNTSLNVMDEPILETVADARRFMEKTPIEYLVIDDFVIKKIKLS